MKNINKIRYITIPLLIILTATFVVVSISLGWYTNVKKMGKIDANTKNSGFSYEINGDTLETDEYQISNLVFFDIDSIYEGKYFDTMVFRIELDITNVTDNEMSYSVLFEGEKKYIENKSNSYVGCIISPEKLGYVLTEDEEAKSGKTYYYYDEITHIYEDGHIPSGDSISPDESLYESTSDYIPYIYEKTTDSVVRLYKTYYKNMGGSNYRRLITKGNSVEKEDADIYELEYESANSYNPANTYYEKIITSSGVVYSEISIDKVNNENYSNYYYVKSTYKLTEDILFQGAKTYYILENDQYVPLETISPGSSSNISSYYEKGSIIKDLIVNSEEVTYTPNYDSENSFFAEYTGGRLGKKDSDNESQRLYLYIFGVQEEDDAVNSDFIELLHNFKISINAKTDSSWTVEENTNS